MSEVTVEAALHRCVRKNRCILAWPEGCPYWRKWACPNTQSVKS